MIVDIGLERKDRKTIADALTCVLADTVILYLKTHNFHWNVRGVSFVALHQFFKDLYEDLIEGGDTIAERVRILGYWVPSFGELSGLSTIKHETHHIMEPTEMLHKLVLDNEMLVRRLKEVYDISEGNKDVSTSDLMVQRITIHSKAAWMLRSHIE